MEYLPRAKVLNDCSLINHLLRHGLEVDHRDSWKHLALLVNLCYGVPEANQLTIKLISSTYAAKIGKVLDTTRDFQQANFLIELLSNCFPRKSTKEVGVVMQPEIWEEAELKNDVFFKSPLYPFRGKHGDAQVLKFLLDLLKAQMEDVILATSISYHSKGRSGAAKLTGSSKGNKSGKHSYVQANHDGVYVWDGEGRFLEIDRRYVEISKTGRSGAKIAIVGKPSRCLRSTNETWLQQFLRAEWFLLECKDQRAFDRFFTKLGCTRKISEVQTYLALTHTDEDLIERVGSAAIEPHRTANFTSAQEPTDPPISRVNADRRTERKDQLATPEQSDERICTDEWDFKPSSEQSIAASTSNLQTEKQLTPAVGVEMESDDGSPLVLAQKRKKIRETTRTLEILKKDFALASNPESSRDDEGKVLQRSPSLLITKFETTTKNLTPRHTNVKSKFATPKLGVAKSIAPKDINILDSIFGRTESSKRHKPNRQQRLKNFKPVIEIPSQDTQVPKSRTHRKKAGAIVKQEAVVVAPKTKTAPQSLSSKEAARATSEVVKRSAEEVAEELKICKKKKKPLKVETQSAQDKSAAKVEAIENPILENTDPMDSTTILGNISHELPMSTSTGNVFTDKLQEQIFSSISLFSNEMVRKMTLINDELNNTIVKELSGKYQRLFQELQKNFQEDTEEMLKFVGEIKDMMKLPESELVALIKTRKPGQ